MSASATFGRKIGLATLGLLVCTIVGVAAWHSGWSRHDIAELAHQAPPWATVSIAIFIAATLSSTVGFAFSAIAAAMIFHLVSDAIEALQIMMVKLPRFRGHPTFWVEGVHDVEAKATLPT
jgi:hypothetical protein